MAENSQKIKLLKLVEILRTETDENNPLKTFEICQKLQDIGISCDRRTLSKDIKLLNDEGYEIMSEFIGHDMAYYVSDRNFSIPELKILIDAVQASSFITPKKTDELIDKIADLGGSHRAEILKEHIVCFNTRKHSNESIYYNIDAIEKAIVEQKKLSFFYFDLNENRERIYRKDKSRYIVEPIALVFNEDNYYLLSYTSKYHNVSNYRIDRMENVLIEEEPISKETYNFIEEKKTSDYTNTVFKMYGGETKFVNIKFDNTLIGAMFDRFGEKLYIKRLDENTCMSTVEIQDSPTFKGWVAQFEGKLEII